MGCVKGDFIEAGKRNRLGRAKGKTEIVANFFRFQNTPFSRMIY